MATEPEVARRLERERNEAREQLEQLAEALEKTAIDFVTFRKVARENGIVGTLGLESLELAAAALAARKGGANE